MVTVVGRSGEQTRPTTKLGDGAKRRYIFRSAPTIFMASDTALEAFSE